MKTAEAQASADSKETQDGLNFFKYFLLGFGGIALFVGGFVIANTLAITVAQRMRELATLRTLGASRRQVLGSVVLESLVIGLVGSIIGLFLGLGIAMGLTALLEATGVELPSSGLVFSTRTIVVSIARRHADHAAREPAAGPSRHARRADRRRSRGRGHARVALRALCGGPVVRSCSRSRSRSSSYGVFAGGLDAPGADRSRSCVGVLLMFVAVAMIAPRVVRPLAFILGAPAARFGGASGRLARQNAVRNPSRTASTAAAVMIGLALITFVAVIGQGFKTSFTSAVDSEFVGDYSLSAGNGAPLTNKAAQAVAKAPGRRGRVRDPPGDAQVGGKTVVVDGVDGD